MHKRFVTLGIAALGFVVAVNGQNLQRKATMVGGGGPDQGRCTVEVLVDSAAEVEIRGDTGTLRNLAGQAPQWRRFECSSAVPGNPPNFRFTGINGRGSQELVRTPQNGGTTLVRIQDSKGGAENYTFELTWGARQTSSNGQRGGATAPNFDPRDNNNNRGDNRGGGVAGRYTTAQAVEVCQNAVRQQAYDRFRAQSIGFRQVALDNNPGRQDWITGILDVRRGFNRDETYSFSCSVNFDNGQVRTAQIDPLASDRVPGYGEYRPDNSRAALEGCERAVEDNLQYKGYQHVDILSIRVDDRAGRKDSVLGSARADIRNRSDSFTFSCAVDLRDGDVRSVNVQRR